MYPSDIPQPDTSNVNFAAGKTVANSVTSRLGPDGRLLISNNSGSVNITVEVVGWYAQAGSLSGSRYASQSPVRILDTRSGISTGLCSPSPCSTLGPGGGTTATIGVKVAGQGGVPAGGATVVALNTGITNPSTTSTLGVHSSNAGSPPDPNLTFAAGATSSVLAVAHGPDGTS